jgi:hypothetical protein
MPNGGKQRNCLEIVTDLDTIKTRGQLGIPTANLEMPRNRENERSSPISTHSNPFPFQNWTSVS